jgi:uncharacterized membrane protein
MYVFSIMLIAGLAALAAAFILTVDKLRLYENPELVLECSVNLVLNCSAVMETWQSHIFGFPNMLLGLMAFPLMILTAVFGLARTALPRWYWRTATVGFFAALIFSYWLFFQSVYAIEILCPWCLTVTTSMTLVFASVLHYDLKENIFAFRKKLNNRIQRFLRGGYHQAIVIGWLVLMVVLVILKFGDGLFA